MLHPEAIIATREQNITLCKPRGCCIAEAYSMEIEYNAWKIILKLAHHKGWVMLVWQREGQTWIKLAWQEKYKNCC